MFSYCYNNPVMYSDPAGYEAYPATGDSAKLAANLGIFFGGLVFFSNILTESEFLEFCNKHVIPNKDDLDLLAKGFIKLAYSMRISEILGNYANSGSAIGTAMDIGELAGASFGAAGYVFTGFVGLMKIASVAFDPLSTSKDVFNTTLSVVNSALGGVLAAALATGAMSIVISSGGTGLWAIGAGVLTYFIAGDIIDYFLL